MKKDEISSTEKLLEQIRGNSSSSDPSLSPTLPQTSSRDWRNRFRSVFNLRKPVCIGVDIGYADLRLIQTVQSAPNRHKITDFRHVPFDPGLDTKHLLFPRFLRESLTSFGQTSDSASIWTTISSARLDTRLLRIPKVARRQIGNAVIWAFKKKSPFNDQERLFDFEILGDVPDADTPQIEVLAYTIARQDIDSIKASFTRAGFALDGISTYPFLLQNLLRSRWQILGQGVLCALYIGRNWSRIDLFKNGNLMLSRGIRAGMNSMIEAIKSDPRIAAEKNADTSGEIDFQSVSPAKAQPEASSHLPAAILTRLIPALGAAEGQDPTDQLGDDFEPDDVFELIRPALDRLVRQVERTIGHYAINFEERDIDRLCLSGMICENDQIREYIAEQLGIPLIDLNPFENETLTDMPTTRPDQLAYLPAVGLASASESGTPNFLQTYHDRWQREKRQIFNSIVFGLFLLFMVGFLGYNSWQKSHLVNRHQHMLQLQQELETFVPLLKPETVLVLAAKTKEATGRLTQFSDKYKGMAIIAELSRMTPDYIYMTQIAIRLPRHDENNNEKQNRLLSVDGIIRGERLDLESTLAAYMIQMKESPLFEGPRIVDKSFEMLGGREVLRFTAELEII